MMRLIHCIAAIFTSQFSFIAAMNQSSFIEIIVCYSGAVAALSVNDNGYRSELLCSAVSIAAALALYPFYDPAKNPAKLPSLSKS